jgi:mannose-6-phosphate isomerase-like protein (cupin superfamily)
MYRRAMGYDVLHSGTLEWEDRPTPDSEVVRRTADVTTAANLTESRARMWVLPPHTRGRRHKEGDQEEVFVPLRGTLTILLGEPPERIDVEPGGVVVVHPGTPLQLRNEADEELHLFAYGAPPVTGSGEFLEDVKEI